MSLQDSIITLNPGRDGDQTDATEFLLYDAFGTPIFFTSGPRAGTQESVKRERVVISGDDSRENIVNPVKFNGQYRLPTYDEHQRRALDRQYLQLEALLSKQLPTGQMSRTASVPVTLAYDQPPVPVTTRFGNLPSYSASTNGTVTTSTAIGSSQSIAYLFHPGNTQKEIRIGRITVGWAGGTGNAVYTLLCAFITAENAVPGGTLRTINAHDTSDPPSIMTFRTGAAAPTRVAGDLFVVTAFAANAQSNNFLVFEPTLSGKPIVLPAGLSRGFEVRNLVGSVALTAAAQVSVYMTWNEVGPS